MIEEAYVSFEVAKLLKEKGFDEPLRAIYRNGDIVRIIVDMSNSDLERFAEAQRLSVVEISAPTQQMAMRWLREVHNIMIIIYHSIESGTLQFTWRVNMFTRDSDHFIIRNLEGVGEYYTYGHDRDTYEEAFEAAIKYCLEYLID